MSLSDKKYTFPLLMANFCLQDNKLALFESFF